ncbi:hypothetical protein [uncultured Cellulomonas sp.]|uniref:hypothetical protein n=1 Tax=uncultured Cellulomonas sp. TaxID=189682 RepID=UPI0028F1009E|nr:hypothetical protein [uncultured Cellulomonas sp.]
MGLTVRLTSAALPDTGATLSGPGLVVGAVCAVLFLVLGLANYAGYFRFVATAYILSPYVILACAWLGGGALLVLAGVWLLGLGPVVATVAGIVLAAVGALAWVVGLVGLVWLPRRLRPRWMCDLLDRRRAGEDVQGGVWR